MGLGTIDIIARGMAASASDGDGVSAGNKLTKVSTATVTETIAANNALMCTGTPTAITVTLGAPKADVTTEYSLTFVAGTSCALTVTAPDGYSLVYPDGTPTLTDGSLYEFSFAVDDASHIVGLYKEVALS